ncbi:hypothetical protein CEP52_009689 [Fusarium oligoseptatum]|uniref:Uncharacterized protein n=1 Tax=Fusarium oligoseptatum TaxID=2604345 RepID=A0A428TBT0_9HYPO|nr:hypothetical protein CEP52_009689 [Fusarium oligoseptatum]
MPHSHPRPTDGSEASPIAAISRRLWFDHQRQPGHQLPGPVGYTLKEAWSMDGSQFLDSPFPPPPVSTPTSSLTFDPREECPLAGGSSPLGPFLVVGYGVKTWLDMVQTRRMAQIEAMERENAAFRERNETLMNMYGDRSSLNELEKAIEFYEKR